VLALALGGAARPAAAQWWGVRLGLGQVRAAQVTEAADTVARSGMAWTLDGTVSRGWFTLAVRYLQGGLGSDDPSRETSVVEGEAILWVAPVRWGAVGLGRHLRAYVEPGGTEHWTQWQLRGRGTAQLTGVIAAYGELWLALGAGLPGDVSLGSGRGLEGGLSIQVSRLIGALPQTAHLHLRYRVNGLSVGDAGRRETVESLGIALGIGRR
jgi:hypothetical protein